MRRKKGARRDAALVMPASQRAGTITPGFAVYETLRPCFRLRLFYLDIQGISQ
jgi:hypothetical protein